MHAAVALSSVVLGAAAAQAVGTHGAAGQSRTVAPGARHHTTDGSYTYRVEDHQYDEGNFYSKYGHTAYEADNEHYRRYS
ncbi:hypothetical protein [Streptomyces sp. NBC_00648]|uniref:hypothetical protein n=1 Tax=Streptomyces sp. NBC_00648 TaxID=2975797 RepID=UPI003246C84D